MTKKLDLTKNETVEYYINSKLFKVCPYSMWDKLDDKVKDILSKKGYEEVWIEKFRTEIPSGSKVYVNIKKGKCLVVGEKINTGLTDRLGYPLYYDDMITDSDGHKSRLNMHYNNEAYYVRWPKYENWYGVNYHRGDVTVDLVDFKDWKKVEDAMDIDKKFWKKPATITEKEI